MKTCNIHTWEGARKECPRPAEFSVRNTYNRGSQYGPKFLCGEHLPVFLRGRNSAQALVTPLTQKYVYNPAGQLIDNPDYPKEEVTA